MPLSAQGKDLAQRVFRQHMETEREERARSLRKAEDAAKGDSNVMGSAQRLARILEASIELVGRSFLESRLEAYDAEGAQIDESDAEEMIVEMRKVVLARSSHAFDVVDRSKIMLTSQREGYRRSFDRTAELAIDRVTNEIRIAQLRRRVSSHEGALANAAPVQSARDRVTDLLPRGQGEDRLSRELSAVSSTAPLAVIMLDLDEFKPINDTLGHPAGDSVLRGVSSYLRQTCEPRGGAFRWGGDEFLVLFPSTAYEEAALVAQRLRSGIAALRFTGVDRGITASVGVLVVEASGAEAEVVKAVDRAMYRSKHGSRNAVTVERFGPELPGAE